MPGAAAHHEEAPLLATTAETPRDLIDDGRGGQRLPDAAGESTCRLADAPAGRARWLVFRALAAVVLFVLALVPRIADLGHHATADEDLTLLRSANVALAIDRHDWWGTYQIGHPEATVQLLVALALGPDALRPYAGDFLGPDARNAVRAPGYFDTLVRARQVLAPIHALLIVVAALLAWRLWGWTVGLLSGLLLALEPFLVAHGRILRTDALLSELMLVAILSALAFWARRAGWWALALCTASTGLALLTKTPALALLGAVPLVAVASSRQSPTPSPSHPRAGEEQRAGRVRRRPPWIKSPKSPEVLRSGAYARGLGGRRRVGLLIWLLGSALLVVALWPAMWVRPLRALERMVVYTQEKGGSPMDAGGFFLGAPVPDPGPLYYALVLPLRVGPLVLIGLAIWLLLRAPRARQGAGLVLLIGLGLAAVLALLPKKADRYILPAIPFLVVVAAIGIAALAERWRRPGPAVAVGLVGAVGPAVAVGLVGAVELALLFSIWPYPLAAYNPLLGGAPTAARWISVGWGEGLDQLAPVLNARPDAATLTVSTPYPEVLQGQIVGRAVDVDEYDSADYVIRYIAASQRHLGGGPLDAALDGREPLQQVEVAGVPYADLYELDHPTFGGDIQVRQLDLSPSVTPRRGWVTVRLALGPPGGEGSATAGGLTATGAPLDVEVALLNAANPDDAEAAIVRPIVPDGAVSEVKLRAPNGLGRYVLGLRVRDAATGAQVPVTSWPVGAPRLPERLVYPSLDVRVQ
jgi:4-amino-4-deoxy-L-arabinose transferase-like glycosyltransferase